MDENTPTGNETPSAPVTIPADSKAYAEWRMTGKVPEPKADDKPANGAAQTSGIPSDSGDKPGQKSAPAPEAGKEPKETNEDRRSAKARLDEVLTDLKKAGLSPSELKTFKREAQKIEQVKAAPETTEKPPERPKRPKMSDFMDKDDPEAEYETAMDVYESKNREIDRLEAVREFQRTTDEQNRRREFTEKLSDAKQRYGEDAQKVITTTVGEIISDAKIPGAVKAIIEESPVMVDLLYVIGSKPEDYAALLELARNQPGQAIRQIAHLERMVQEELTKGKGNGNGKEAKPAEAEGAEEEEGETPERDESGKFVSRKVSKAPPPGVDIGGHKGTPKDIKEADIRTVPFNQYRDEMNRRDMAKRSGR
jgi:hypothetical protein